MFKDCRVYGCNRPARAGTQDGLDRRFCRSHADHHARHGSPYKSSYAAHELSPHRKAAMTWLTQNEDDRWVRNALDRIRGLYHRAGPHIEAFRLRGLSPRDRAWAAWARLRNAEIDPRRVVAAQLAVEAAIRADPQPELKREFQRVQVAKAVHRMASGSHRSWPQGDGGTTALHVFPRSRGAVLRHFGGDIEEATELIVPLPEEHR